MKNKQNNKEIYLNKEEVVCLNCITASLFALLIVIILTLILLINVKLFTPVMGIIFLYALFSFLFNYIKIKSLIKKRHNEKRRKTSRRTIKR